MTFSLKRLHHRRGAATVGIAALLIGGMGMAPAVSSTLAPRIGTFSGCLATSGARVVFNVVKSPARPRRCPAGSARVHWNAKGKPGARGVKGAQGSAGVNGTNGMDGVDGTDGSDGSTGLPGTAGADGTNGVDGIDGSDGSDGSNGTDGLPGTAGTDGTNGVDGADGVDGSNGAAGADGTNVTDGTNGADGSTGPAGHSSMMSGGVFTLQPPGPYPDTHAYLPLSGYLATQFVAPRLDYDAFEIVVEHTSVEQVIAHDVTITDMYANFGSVTDLGGRPLQVRLTLLVSSGGTQLLVPAGGGCIFFVEGNGPTSNDCSWAEDSYVHLAAGDTAVIYVDAFVNNWQQDSPVNIYGSVALTT